MQFRDQLALRMIQRTTPAFPMKLVEHLIKFLSDLVISPAVIAPFGP